MKPLFLILTLVFTAQAQDGWKSIKEMSGPIPDAGVSIKTSAAQIARGDDHVKLLVRFDFPEGAPFALLKDNVPAGFDVSTIAAVVSKVDLNCKTLVVKMAGQKGDVYLFSGKHFQSREVAFKIESGNIFATYFCEQGEKPTHAPTLKPK